MTHRLVLVSLDWLRPKAPRVSLGHGAVLEPSELSAAIAALHEPGALLIDPGMLRDPALVVDAPWQAKTFAPV